MNQMNLGGSRDRKGFPSVRKTSLGYMLDIAPNCHIYRKENKLIRCECDSGDGIIVESVGNLDEIRDFVEHAYEEEDLFYPAHTHLLHCLPFSALVEVVGDSEELWHGLFATPEPFVEFMGNIFPTFNLDTALHAVEPIEHWPVGEKQGQTKLRVQLKLAYGNAGNPLLSFGERSVQLITANQSCPEGLTTYIRFPDYVRLDEPFISRKEYYAMMWSRLWRQLVSASGLRCTEVGIFSSCEDTHDCLPPRGVEVLRASFPEEVDNFISGYTRTM